LPSRMPTGAPSSAGYPRRSATEFGSRRQRGVGPLGIKHLGSENELSEGGKNGDRGAKNKDSRTTRRGDGLLPTNNWQNDVRKSGLTSLGLADTLEVKKVVPPVWSVRNSNFRYKEAFRKRTRRVCAAPRRLEEIYSRRRQHCADTNLFALGRSPAPPEGRFRRGKMVLLTTFKIPIIEPKLS